MSYNIVPFHLTEAQKAKARSALKHKGTLTVRISSKNIGHGNSKLSLTERQMKDVHHKKSQNLGVQLKISPSAMKHGETHGAGFVGDMLKSGAKMGAKWLVNKAANVVNDKIEGMGMMKSKSKKRVGKGLLGTVGAWGLRGLANVVESGAGIHSHNCHHCGHKQHAAGIISPGY